MTRPVMVSTSILPPYPSVCVLESCGAKLRQVMKSAERVSNGAAPANVLFGINMHEALKPPLIWMKKHLEWGSSIRGHTRRSCQNPGVLRVFVFIT